MAIQQAGLDSDELWSGDMRMEGKRRRMERLEEKYIKWVLGVDRRMPGYMVRDKGRN